MPVRSLLVENASLDMSVDNLIVQFTERWMPTRYLVLPQLRVEGQTYRFDDGLM